MLLRRRIGDFLKTLLIGPLVFFALLALLFLGGLTGAGGILLVLAVLAGVVISTGVVLAGDVLALALLLAPVLVAGFVSLRGVALVRHFPLPLHEGVLTRLPQELSEEVRTRLFRAAA